MAVLTPVRADLRQILLSVPGVPTAIAWEGRAFKPVPGIRWLEEKLIPVGTMPASLGNDGFTREWYVYRITLNSPPASAGLSEDENLADAIRYAYPVGREVGGVTTNGRVTQQARGSLIVGADWRTISVTIMLWVMALTQYDPATP